MATLVEKTADYVSKRLIKEKTGHDWFHIYRVWQLSKFIQKHEGGDLELIELAALLHSATEENYKKTGDDGFRSLAMKGMLDVLDVPEDQKRKIINISNETKYKGNETVRPSSLEGKIVQDANWLDSFGAIGLARVFTAGGYLGRLMYDPKKPIIDEPMNNEQFQKRKREGTSFNYFFEKTFKVPPLMNTETAKRIALKRIQFMKGYLQTFMDEWNMNDVE